jgi:hypothetical protein
VNVLVWASSLPFLLASSTSSSTTLPLRSRSEAPSVDVAFVPTSTVDHCSAITSLTPDG